MIAPSITSTDAGTSNARWASRVAVTTIGSYDAGVGGDCAASGADR
jgi:hypothetical protein